MDLQQIVEIVRSVVLGGLKLTDEERHAAIEKAIEKGFYRRKTTTTRKAVDEENFEMEFTITTDTVDRDSERVKPRSFEKHIGLYQKNPVVLFAHDHKIPAVGKMVSCDFTDDEFSCRDKFAAEESDFAAMLWRLYKGEFMKAVSVGFLPIQWSQNPKDKLPDQSGRTFLINEKLEHSLVNVPSNRDGLAKAYKAPEIDPFFHKFIEALIETPTEQRCGHKTYYTMHGEAVSPCPVCQGQKSMAQKAFAFYSKRENPHIAPEYKAQLEKHGFVVPDSNDPPISDKLATLLSFWEDDVTDLLSDGSQIEGRSYTVQNTSHEPLNDQPIISTRIERSQTELDKFFGRFTFPGTYERVQRDVRMALPDLKSILGFDPWEDLVLRGTTDTFVICFAEDRDLWYTADYTADDSGVTFDNVQLVEVQIAQTNFVGDVGSLTVNPSQPQELPEAEGSRVERGAPSAAVSQLPKHEETPPVFSFDDISKTVGALTSEIGETLTLFAPTTKEN